MSEQDQGDWEKTYMDHSYNGKFRDKKGSLSMMWKTLPTHLIVAKLMSV